jgi:hypothetical protein
MKHLDAFDEEKKDELSEGKSFGTGKYPELEAIATKLADAFLAEIQVKTKNVKSEMTYKAQWVLEEVIKKLKKSV